MADDQVRVRFAPSPTGYLHVGGARTALFNWLFARHSGGRFILRIEDTDQKRQVSDSLTQILADLRWLGLDWDEGPQAGGEFGPYFQSKRKDIYDKYCEQLLESGHAYYAFDSTEELTAMREQARAEKRTFQYPRPTVFPSAEDAKRVASQGMSVVVRFKVPEEDVTVQDSVLGEVTVKRQDLEDFVIRKADGFPTYHFACVVDDQCMNISHVLRGFEHLNNTPKHIALQRTLEFRTPVYAHLPIIFNMSGSKMSKRDKEKALAKGETPPEIDVQDFRRAGYLPEALVNFIALLGWSPGDDRELMAMPELIQSFDIQRIGKANSKFDRDKLLAFNTAWADRSDSTCLLTAFQDYLTCTDSPMRLAAEDVLAKVLEVCQGFRTFADVVKKAEFIFLDDDSVQYDAKAVKKILAKNDGQGYVMLERLLPDLRSLGEWSAASLEAHLKAQSESWEVGFGQVAQPIRVAVSGTTVSPQIGQTLVLLGRDATLRRIERTLSQR